MNSLTAGTFVGAGTFRCRDCGYTLTLDASDALTTARAAAARTSRAHRCSAPSASSRQRRDATLAEPPASDRAEHLDAAREQLTEPGEYLVYEDGDELRTVALTREWTRIGRSLAADVRFDDPTVSRRHALIVRQPDGVRLLDDRSLNGVFVNGAQDRRPRAGGRRRDHRRPLPPALPERPRQPPPRPRPRAPRPR